MDCLSGWVNKTMQKLYFATPILVLGPLNGVKMATNMAKWGEGGYKLFNFEGNDAYEVSRQPHSSL